MCVLREFDNPTCLRECARQGRASALAGVERSRNPYPFDSQERAAWSYGWREGDRAMRVERARERAAVRQARYTLSNLQLPAGV